VGLCTLLTAIIVSFVGAVGFVGFLLPHLTRRLVGPNFRYLLPGAMVLGAVFVLAAYILVAALLGPDFETMSGMYISIFGAVVFLELVIRNKGGARNGIR
jgi:iron complex transport system permease protein